MNRYIKTNMYDVLDRLPTHRVVRFHFQCWQDGDEEGMDIAENILYFRGE